MAVNSDFRHLALRQIDKALARWREAALPARPRSGWIRSVRRALGMSARALAERAGVSESSIRGFEAAEAGDTITLASLRRLADAMDCELQYALVPRIPLAEQLKRRARQVAMQKLSPVSHTMALEAQKVAEDDQAAQVEWAAERILRESLRKLW